MFESFLEGLSSWSAHKKWKQIKARVTADPEDQATPEEEEHLTSKERNDFHGWVIKAVANIGNTGKHQLFFVSFVAKYHGISNMGNEILAQYGYGTQRSQYTTLVQETIARARTETR